MPGKALDKVNIADKFSLFDELWSPKVIAQMNQVQFKLVKIQGEFTWHSHKATDEVFMVIAGDMVVECRDKTIALSAGEMFVIPKGVEHKPYAKEQCQVMIIEPEGVTNTGDAGGALTAQNDVWI
ncbi:cupin domain-containing protein [Thalassomonas haliotis]|uniref:Cupin domain-containing protein n=1 Tax=Thalassomonas haliotis TaxID=485448 RepID=A0ABY7VLG5_9GAMM|nr:cupin domain-containing protein [Thalassomonas haliotis]WDE14331.1 cupin domain-containing protein [Thalassomonas haliotis]